MSDSNLPPEQWRPLFDKRQIAFGYRPLAAKLDMNHTRIRRLLLGGGTTEDALRQVADFFGVPVAKVRELRGEAAVEREPFTLPDDAGRLTERERDVIRSMVRVLLEAREQAHAVPTHQAATSGASGEAHQKQEVMPEPPSKIETALGDHWAESVDWSTIRTPTDVQQLVSELAEEAIKMHGQVDLDLNDFAAKIRNYADALRREQDAEQSDEVNEVTQSHFDLAARTVDDEGKPI